MKDPGILVTWPEAEEDAIYLPVSKPKRSRRLTRRDLRRRFKV